MKKFVCGLVLGAAIATAVGVGASGVWENIPVLRNDIRVVVDGAEITADNFLYEDTTYIPLRAVSSALGEDVEYDEAENTAYIGERNDTMVLDKEDVNSKYIPDENLITVSIDGSYYIMVSYGNVGGRLKGSIGYDDETEEVIYTFDNGSEKRIKYIVYREHPYIPYDTFVDEILPFVEAN